MRRLGYVFALVLVTLASGCSGMFESKAAADRGVAEFHEQYNAEKLADIYAAGDEGLKNATSEKEFLEFLTAVRTKLGKVTNTSNVGFHVRTVNLATTVELTQDTTFEQGSGTEKFTFAMDGDRAVLLGYHIDAKELVTK